MANEPQAPANPSQGNAAFGFMPTLAALTKDRLANPQLQNIFGPAGLTDAQRYGAQYGLTGIGQQYAPAAQYSAMMGNFAGNAGDMWANRMSQGGWDPRLANQINQTGASFDPYNNPALMQSISAGNQELARQFNQNVMPQMNQSMNASGPGAYGGTRAGVMEGIARQGLTDAMSKQTSDRLAQGYESGLNRYVGDRGNTLNATLDAARQNNNMFQFGFGALPGIYQQGASMGMLPGQVTQQYGQALGQFGGMQQQANQNQLNWANQQYNQMVNNPWDQLGNYNALAGNYLLPESIQNSSSPGVSPWQAAAGGAAIGQGIYNQWGGGGSQSQMPDNVYNAAQGQNWWR